MMCSLFSISSKESVPYDEIPPILSGSDAIPLHAQNLESDEDFFLHVFVIFAEEADRVGETIYPVY